MVSANTADTAKAASPSPSPYLGWAFLFAHPAHFIALGAGSGLSPIAPGTVGTVFVWVLFHLWPAVPEGVRSAFAQISLLEGLALLGLGLLICLWACKVTAKHLGMHDPGSVVIDEIVAFGAVLCFIAPCSFSAQLGAFVLFRVLDAMKPGFIGQLDRAFKDGVEGGGEGGGYKGAVGILLDDLAAAFVVLLVFAFIRF